MNNIANHALDLDSGEVLPETAKERVFVNRNSEEEEPMNNESDLTPGTWNVAIESGHAFLTDADYNELPYTFANLQMQAAAPDLVAAANRALPILDRCLINGCRCPTYNESGEIILCEACELRAAINKATGERQPTEPLTREEEYAETAGRG